MSGKGTQPAQTQKQVTTKLEKRAQKLREQMARRTKKQSTIKPRQNTNRKQPKNVSEQARREKKVVEVMSQKMPIYSADRITGIMEKIKEETQSDQNIGITRQDYHKLTDHQLRNKVLNEIVDYENKLIDNNEPSVVGRAGSSLAEKMMKEYKPDMYHFVMLGNSPGPLTKRLDKVEADYSFLPLSGLSGDYLVTLARRYGDTSRYTEALINYYETDPDGKKFKRYVDSYLETIKGGKEKPKPLVVMDFVQSGASVLAVSQLLLHVTNKKYGERYDKKNNPYENVSMYTFTNQQMDESHTLNETGKIHHKGLSTERETDQLTDDEKAFIYLEDQAKIKTPRAINENDKIGMGLNVYKGPKFTLDVLESRNEDETEYGKVWKEIENKDGIKKLKELKEGITDYKEFIRRKFLG